MSTARSGMVFVRAASSTHQRGAVLGSDGQVNDLTRASSTAWPSMFLKVEQHAIRQCPNAAFDCATTNALKQPLRFATCVQPTPRHSYDRSSTS